MVFLRQVLIGGPCWDGLPALFNTFCRFSTGGSVCVAAPVGIVSVLSLLKFAAAQECAGCKFVRTLLLLQSRNREVAGVVRSRNDSHSIAGGGELDQMFAGLGPASRTNHCSRQRSNASLRVFRRPPSLKSDFG